LQLQSSKCVPQVKASCIVEAMTSLGGESAGMHRAASHVSTHRRQMDSRTSELLPHEISLFKELRLGLINTQRRV
jgi:hypothetical protein